MSMTVDEYLKSVRQDVGDITLELGRLTQATWNETAVKSILRRYRTEAVRRVMTNYMKFSGIFTAGKQVIDWCYDVICEREKDSSEEEAENSLL